jgi:uncharacterized phage-associated protein
MSLLEFAPPFSGNVREELATDVTTLESVAAMAHYVVAKAQPGKLGHVKLNKILWYSDLEYYRWHGVSLTGLRQYSRMPQGPISSDVARAVGRLVKAEKVAERTIQIDGFPRREIVSLEYPDRSMINDEQADILDRMTSIIAPLTANQLGRMTHDDRLWQQVETGEAMSVATGSVMSPPLRSN